MRPRLYCFGPVAGLPEGKLALDSLSEIAAELDGAGATGASQDVAVVLVAPPVCASLADISRLRTAGYLHVLVVMLSLSDVPMEDRLALLDAGASDLVPWDDRRASSSSVRARLARWQAIERLLNDRLVQNNLVGSSAAWQKLLRQVLEIAHFTSTSVLLSGETGTGKELLARLIHAVDARPNKSDLVVLDCATIVPDLSGSEFFGHERGAFTGAGQSRAGAFQLAHRGTLFLDEVGELPLALQAQLLRVIQEKTFKPVGSNVWQATEFRLVCATHRDLMEQVRRGEFRHDLYHRIATWPVRLPPLRERPEDILPLARHLASHQSGAAALEFDEGVQRYLVTRDYPGNVRELRHVVQRLADRHPGAGPITLGQVPEDERKGIAAPAAHWPDDAFELTIRRALSHGVGLKRIGRIAEDLAVRLALSFEDGNVARASRRLGITDRALQLRQAAQRRDNLGELDVAEPADVESAVRASAPSVS